MPEAPDDKYAGYRMTQSVLKQVEAEERARDADLPKADPTSLDFSRGDTGTRATLFDRLDTLNEGAFNGRSGDGTRGLADLNDPLRRELAGVLNCTEN